jgi:hypothetical protein
MVTFCYCYVLDQRRKKELGGAARPGRPDLAVACRLPWPGLPSVRQRFPHSLLQPPAGIRSAPHATRPGLLYCCLPARANCHLIAARARLLLLAAALLLVSPGPPESRPPVRVFFTDRRIFTARER